MLSFISHTGMVLTLLSSSLCFAGANPLPAAEPIQSLATRGNNEGLYLVNCLTQYPTTSSQASQMAYYKNGRSRSQNGEQPDDFAWFVSIIIWEGLPQTATSRNSGGSATSHIKYGAHDYSTGTYAGTASINGGDDLKCWKDNYRPLYSRKSPDNQATITCWSIYYCFDA